MLTTDKVIYVLTACSGIDGHELCRAYTTKSCALREAERLNKLLETKPSRYKAEHLTWFKENKVPADADSFYVELVEFVE